MSKKKALSFSQFIKRFPNEEACVKYLYAVKWPKGFMCPVCGHRGSGGLLHPGAAFVQGPENQKSGSPTLWGITPLKNGKSMVY